MDLRILYKTCVFTSGFTNYQKYISYDICSF